MKYLSVTDYRGCATVNTLLYGKGKQGHIKIVSNLLTVTRYGNIQEKSLPIQQKKCSNGCSQTDTQSNFVSCIIIWILPVDPKLQSKSYVMRFRNIMSQNHTSWDFEILVLSCSPAIFDLDPSTCKKFQKWLVSISEGIFRFVLNLRRGIMWDCLYHKYRVALQSCLTNVAV